MSRQIKGDLNVGLARPLLWVRCIIVPDISIWQLPGLIEQQFELPKLMGKYQIRSSWGGAFGGILLMEIKNPEVIRLLVEGEPSFPHECFNIIPTP